MPLQFHPIALLHTIVVDTYYRKLGMYIFSWRSNNQDYRDRTYILNNWIAVHRANKNSRANLCELRRIIKAVRTRYADDERGLSPQTTRDLSLTNNNPYIV